MQSRRTALVNVLLVAAIALSGLLVNVPTGTGNRAQDGASVLNSGAAAKGKHHQRERKQKDRKRDRKSSQHNRRTENTPSEITPTARQKDWKDHCDDEKLVRLYQNELCTHGGDSKSQFTLDNDKTESVSAAAESAGFTCDDDGPTVGRVQVLYVHGTNQLALDENSSLRPHILQSLADADLIFQMSALETGSARNIRFVQEGPDRGCLPTILDVELTTPTVGAFGPMITQLGNKGYKAFNRIYLSFTPAEGNGCGIGTIFGDDQLILTNMNNVGPSYSRVYGANDPSGGQWGCWSGTVAAHELMHNLGGVQDSAPNTSLGYHCIDEWDVMCYRDSPNYPQMHYVCQPDTLDDTELDCRHDDYYNTNPAPGSYLDRCWNPANNQFLIGADALPSEASACIPSSPSDFSSPTVSVTVPSSSGPQRDVGLSATASDNVGVASVAFGVCLGSSCDWNSAQSLGEVGSAPYMVSWRTPKKGTFTFLAQAVDSSGNTGTSSPASLRVKAKNKKSKHKKGGHKGNGKH